MKIWYNINHGYKTNKSFGIRYSILFGMGAKVSKIDFGRGVKRNGKELFEEILAARDCEIEEMEIAEDHVHIFASILPKYSIGEMVRVLKSISAKEICRRDPEVNKALWGGEFWEDGYFVRTVGDKVTSETIKKYINCHRYIKERSLQLEFDF